MMSNRSWLTRSGRACSVRIHLVVVAVPLLLLCCCCLRPPSAAVVAFSPQATPPPPPPPYYYAASSSFLRQHGAGWRGSGLHMVAEGGGDEENEADRMKRKAEELREQIRKMEDQLGDRRKARGLDDSEEGKGGEGEVAGEAGGGKMSLKGKRVLVAGANGRLGSMVCRYLLRNYPGVEVVAAVHYVGEDSPTARGYGRLSYEVGAEDGVGSIGPAWNADERTATFQYDAETMGGYNLQNLRLVECELLDPVQCQSVSEGCDAVIWCATDFNGNRPRAISGLNVAFLFRAAANPDKGRVEIEGLQNMLGALKQARQDKNWSKGKSAPANDPVNFVLVSSSPQAFENFETPFGEFNAIKREGEEMMKRDFPSLTSTVIQIPRFEDNFVDEGLDIMLEESSSAVATEREKALRKINRRDAAKAVVDALLNEELVGKTVQVWTSPS